MVPRSRATAAIYDQRPGTVAVRSLNRPLRRQSSRFHIVSAPPPHASPARGQARSFHHYASLKFAQAHSLPGREGVEEADIVIVGGGVVGLALACAIATSPSVSSSRSSSLPLQIDLVESSSLSRLREWAAKKGATSSPEGHVDWENRVISLNEENLAWLEDIGVAGHLVKSRLRKVERMQVWDGLTGSEIVFDAHRSKASSSKPAQLSTMVELSNLQQAMLSALQQHSDLPSPHVRVRIRDEVRVGSIEPSSRAATQAASEENDVWPLLSLVGPLDTASADTVSGTGPSTVRLRTRLLVGADGATSPVRTYAGIGKYGWPYDRRGVVGTLRCAPRSGLESLNDGHTAWQRFLPTGPIAWLPLSTTSGSMVWTLPPDIARAVAVLQTDTASTSAAEQSPLGALIDAAFRLPWVSLSALLQRVKAISGSEQRDWSWLVPEAQSALVALSQSDSAAPLPPDVPPPCHSVDSRSVASFPLNLSHADAYLGSSLLPSQMPSPSSILSLGLTIIGANPLGGSAEGRSEPPRSRTVLVGDAAHSIHPHVGQGLNLGLRDARILTETIDEAVRAGADLGSHYALAPYPRQTYLHNQAVLSAADHLHWIYSVGGGGMEGSRSATSGLIGRAMSSATVWARSTAVDVLNELDSVKTAMMETAGSRRRQH